jgi:hypothetical protein
VVIGIENTHQVFSELLGKIQVALAERSSASSDSVFAVCFLVSAFDAPVVLDKLADALGSEFLSNALLALFVFVALDIKLVDWFSVSHVAHRPIAENETLATVRPIFSFVKFRVVVFHHLQQIVISSWTELSFFGLTGLEISLSQSDGDNIVEDGEKLQPGI